MLITRKSPLTGKFNEREIDIDMDQLTRYHKGDELIQNIMPDISSDDREFLITGYTPEDWESIFPEEDGMDVTTLDEVLGDLKPF